MTVPPLCECFMERTFQTVGYCAENVLGVSSIQTVRRRWFQISQSRGHTRRRWYKYNTTFHVSTGVMSCHLRWCIGIMKEDTRVEAVAQLLRSLDKSLHQLKYNLQKAQDHMKLYADAKRKDVHFAVAHSVFLK